MTMSKEGLRLYAMGLILLVLVANIPEVRSIIEEKVIIAKPKAAEIITLTLDNVTSIVAPLAGKILGNPQVVINGVAQPVDTKNDFSLSHGQSVTAEQIDTILKEVDSPAYGTGAKWIKSGTKHNIDAAYMVYIFIHESSAATNKGWAGFKPDGTHTYNVGNVICAGYDGNKDGTLDCFNGFRDYSWSGDPWGEGIEDNTANLAQYRDGRGIKTLDEALKIWAPSSDGNNPVEYFESGKVTINGWRNTNAVIANKGGNVITDITTRATQKFDNAQAVSAPITEDKDNDFGFNVKAALDSNNGALRNIVIKDGEQWSFNGAMLRPNDKDGNELKLRWVSGTYGGGWCDLACRYVQVFKGLGLQIKHVPLGYGEDLPKDGQLIFIQHGGIALNNCSYDESPYIWSDYSAGFHEGMQDMIINNNTGKTIKIGVIDNPDGTATIAGKLE